MQAYLDDFATALESRFSDDRTDMSMSEWVSANTRLKKRPFSYKGYEFQRQILDDMHPDLSCIKPSQVGLTEIQIRKFLAFLKRTTALTGIFTLPNDKMRDRISQTRIKPLVDEEAAFNQHSGGSKPIRHKGLYQIDGSFGYVTGSTEGDATSIAADFLMHDEIDLTNQAMVGLFQSRLQGSTVRITQKFSTPTFVGYGIDASYNVSDKHEYVYRCHSCNHYQTPSFHPKFVCLPGNPIDDEDLSLLTEDQIAKIDFDKTHVRCERCSTPVTHDPLHWEWVATHPGRRTRGYRVPALAVRTITPNYILNQLIKFRALSNIRAFHNTVLGNAFNDSNARLQESQIRACMVGGQSPSPTDYASEECFLGIDVGITCHIVIGKAGLIFHWEQVPQSALVARVKTILETYNIVAGGIDLEPYRPTAEEIRDLSEGRILPMDYSTTNNAPPLVQKTDELDQLSHLVVNRTQALDTVASMIRKSAVKFTGYGTMDRLMLDQFQDMIRIEEPDHDARWEKLTGNDHFFHALAYLFLAMKSKMALDFASNSEKRFSLLISAGNFINLPSSILNRRG